MKYSLILLLLLAGCASVESVNEKQVIIKASQYTLPEAQALADEQCAKFGKSAVFNSTVGHYRVSYRCE